MTGQPRVPGLNDDWADQQLDLLAVLRDAMDAVEAAPVQPDPPVCRNCTHVADVPGGPVFACQSARGCLLDRLGPELTRERRDPLAPRMGDCGVCPVPDGYVLRTPGCPEHWA